MNLAVLQLWSPVASHTCTYDQLLRIFPDLEVSDTTTDATKNKKLVTKNQTLQNQTSYISQHSLKLIGIFTAKPPSAVSLYLLFISSAVSHIVLITLSKLTFA